MNILEINSNDFQSEVLESKIPVVVYFYSDGCRLCDTFKPMLDSVEEKYRKSIKFVKIARLKNRELASRYNINKSPAVIFFNEGIEVSAKLKIYNEPKRLIDEIENLFKDNLNKNRKKEISCDVLILGAGPAGLTAGIFAGRAKLKTIILDEAFAGGQVATTFDIANYPGTKGVVRGMDLVDNMKAQALSFGCEIYEMKSIDSIELNSQDKSVSTQDEIFKAKSIIISTGAQPRKLPVEEEAEFRGRGIHYCATCDGAFYIDKEVVVVGGGVSALEEAEFLTRFAKNIIILNRKPQFKAPDGLIKEVEENPSIEVLYNKTVQSVHGESYVESIIIKDTLSGATESLKTDAVFAYIGLEPKTEYLKDQIKLSEGGYIITNEKMETSVNGIFACGDGRDKEIRQIATAVGDGAIAGVMSERYIKIVK